MALRYLRIALFAGHSPMGVRLLKPPLNWRRSSLVHDATHSRFYYNRFARSLLRGQGVLGFVILLSLTGGHMLVILRIASGVFAIAWLSVAWFWFGRTVGVEVLADGIRVGRGFRRRIIPWRDIKTFRIVREAFSPPVCVELTSGKLVTTTLVQGRKMFWTDGASNDMVGVLNHELDEAQATSHAP